MGQVGPQPAGQTHDYNPGIASNGLFWTIRIPAGGLAEADPEQGTASYRLSQLATRDYHNLANALADGPSDPATVSFDVTWGAAGEPFEVRDEENGFTGTFRETKSTISWSASGGDAVFVSDRPETSRTVFAAVGRERNGVFFS